MHMCIDLASWKRQQKFLLVPILAISSGIAELDKLVGYKLTATIGCECFIRVI